MKKLVITLLITLFITTLQNSINPISVRSVYADVTHCIVLTDTEDKAMQVLEKGALGWIQWKAKDRARRMIEDLAKPRTTKNVQILTEAEKANIMDSVDVASERKKRFEPEPIIITTP